MGDLADRLWAQKNAGVEWSRPERTVFKRRNYYSQGYTAILNTFAFKHKPAGGGYGASMPGSGTSARVPEDFKEAALRGYTLRGTRIPQPNCARWGAHRVWPHDLHAAQAAARAAMKAAGGNGEVGMGANGQEWGKRGARLLGAGAQKQKQKLPKKKLKKKEKKSALVEMAMNLAVGVPVECPTIAQWQEDDDETDQQKQQEQQWRQQQEQQWRQQQEQQQQQEEEQQEQEEEDDEEMTVWLLGQIEDGLAEDEFRSRHFRAFVPAVVDKRWTEYCVRQSIADIVDQIASDSINPVALY